MPILAKGKTVTGHIWTYVRDDRPFGGRAAPAALYYASRDRRQEHPERHLRSFAGILQTDAYSGYNALYDPSRTQGAITPALCWSHARRQFFELADIAANARRGRQAPAISPIAFEAVKRIDALFDIERAINGLDAGERLLVRQEQSRPLLTALEAWLRDERSRLSRSASVVKPIDYLLRRSGSLHGLPRRRQNLPHEQCCRAAAQWLFAGCERGAARAAAMSTLTLATSASRPFAKSFETSSIQLANRRQLVVPSNPARRGPYRMLTLHSITSIDDGIGGINCAVDNGLRAKGHEVEV